MSRPGSSRAEIQPWFLSYQSATLSRCLPGRTENPAEDLVWTPLQERASASVHLWPLISFHHNWNNSESYELIFMKLIENILSDGPRKVSLMLWIPEGLWHHPEIIGHDQSQGDLYNYCLYINFTTGVSCSEWKWAAGRRSTLSKCFLFIFKSKPL